MFFRFEYEGKIIWVPCPKLTDKQKKDNLIKFGTEYGIMQITILGNGQEVRILSSSVKTYAPDEPVISPDNAKEQS